MLRSVRLLGVTTILAVLMLPQAAYAAAPAEIDLKLPQVTMPVDEDRREIQVLASISAPADAITVVLDLSGASGVAELPEYAVAYPPESACARTGAVVTCTAAGPFAPGAEFRLADLWLRAAPGATAGATGVMRVTASADGGPESTATSAIRIGEGVDLTSLATIADIEPGREGGARPRVRNSGDTTVDGVVMTADVHPDLVAEERFGNCTYGARVTCTFGGELAPGATYRFSADLWFRIPSDAARGSQTGSRAEWLTPAEWADRGLPAGRPGTGPPVTLEQVASARIQADENPGDNHSPFLLRAGGESADTDVSLTGATLRGAVGDQVPTSFTVVNNGPGTFYRELFDGVSTPVGFYLPRGLTIVRASEGCAIDATRSSMTCDAQPAEWGPGKIRYDVTVRFGEGVTGDEDGTVTINAGELPVNRADSTWLNNEVPIDIVVLADGGGGGLPITGPGAGGLALTGIFLVLAGFLLVRLGRREVVHS